MTSTLLRLLAVVALILANAFFVSGEFALVAVERSRIERMAEEGSRRAARVLAALRSLSFQLSGAQLGITVSSLVLGFVAEPTIAVLLRPALAGLGMESTRALSIGLALALATVFQMVLGELVPKNLAIARPLGSAMAIAAPMQWVNDRARPIIELLNQSANRTVRLLGIEPREELQGVRSLEELELLIRSSGEGGEIDAIELRLLTRSISFGEMVAADVMVPRVSIVAVGRDDSLVDLARQALESGHSRFPVVAEDLDDVSGVVHVKDIFTVPYEERSSTPVASVSQTPLAVPEARPLDEVLLDMQRQNKQLAVVVDEYGGIAGIVTAEDIVEEIVGEIEDEHDVSEHPPLPADQGDQTVSGLLHRNDVREATGFEMPEGRYETLGGFLISRLGRFPRTGERITFEGWTFEIVSMDRYRVDQVLLTAPAHGADR